MFEKFRRKAVAPAIITAPSGPADARAYAIGDVHGRLDLLRNLLEQIEADSRANPCEREYIVFVGDLIDRGPDSHGVIDLLLRSKKYLPHPVFLMGNHEEMMLRVLDKPDEKFRDWLTYGGYECAQSYGVEVGRLAAMDVEHAAALVNAAIPSEHRAFIASFADSFRFGDYVFVHAGIRPGVPLDAQSTRDLRWIREDFLDSTVAHPFVVVHGHTITSAPDEQPNRIGIDTGAYASGVLTAIRIEGTTRNYLQAQV
ncbi:metallophosphoesterase family protein [Sphingomonas sp. RT2P30]|uniref:metallophosphoesterase family protein n=1 Tax=Parasphingomonas halimpatiens TaxID=3096162 RepID=UPI002FCA9F2E